MSGPYRGVRVLVLGASGFVGRWVARALGEQGAESFLAVRDLERASVTFARYGVAGQPVTVDLGDPESLEQLVRDIRPTVTFNLSGYGVDPTERDDATAYAVNTHLVERLCNVLAATSRPGWTGLDCVHVGSALEYGEAGGILAEETEPHPTTVYGQSKLAGTRRLAGACQELGLKGVTARLFTVYGPGEHPGRLLPALLEAAATGAPLPLSAGRQKRDFTYVEDVVEGLLRLGQAQAPPGEIVNLATGRLMSVRDFVDVAAGILDIQRGQLQFGAIPTRVEEMEHAEVSVDRLRRLVGWVPSVPVEAGIRRTAEFLQRGALAS